MLCSPGSVDHSPRIRGPIPHTRFTTHQHPATAGRDRSVYWKAAEPYSTFRDSVRSYAELWAGAYDRAILPLGTIERVGRLRRRWHILAVSADWCIDAPPVVGLIARLADEAGTIELAHIDRDEYVELIDEHLTNARSRSIPILILLDEHFIERAWWGPRPAPLQAWVMGEGAALPSVERFRFSRQWMARDRGQTVLEEVVCMIEGADAAGAGA